MHAMDVHPMAGFTREWRNLLPPELALTADDQEAPLVGWSSDQGHQPATVPFQPAGEFKFEQHGADNAGRG
jgi:hypothetical protein